MEKETGSEGMTAFKSDFHLLTFYFKKISDLQKMLQNNVEFPHTILPSIYGKAFRSTTPLSLSLEVCNWITPDWDIGMYVFKKSCKTESTEGGFRFKSHFFRDCKY